MNSFKKIIKILFWTIVFIFIIVVTIKINLQGYGGCYPRDDIDASIIKIEPQKDCLGTTIMMMCDGKSINMSIQSECKEQYILVDNNGKKLSKYGNNIPQEYGTRERRLINTENHDDSIIIKGNNTKSTKGRIYGVKYETIIAYLYFLSVIVVAVNIMWIVIKNLIKVVNYLRKKL